MHVSRETKERLRDFADLLLKWNKRINLIAPSTAEEIWQRHIEDSLQVIDLPVDTGCWVDLGSGGGFPGIIAAIARADTTELTTLVESDARKCAFLRQAIAQLNLRATVIQKRIEDVPPQGATVVSARALADLTRLLNYADLHLADGGEALFLKGKSWGQEVSDAKASWSFDYDVINSRTQADAVILKVTRIERI